MRRFTRSLAWFAAAVAAALLAGALVLRPLGGTPSTELEVGLLMVAVTAATVGAALALLLRGRGVVIGWLLMAQGVLVALNAFGEEYARAALLGGHDLPGGTAAAAWSSANWVVLLAPAVAIAFVFPDARLPSPRWRPVALFALVVMPVAVLVRVLTDAPLDPPFERFRSPLGVVPENPVFYLLHFVPVLFVFVAAGLAIRARNRRATGVERAQLKWLISAALLLVSVIPIFLLAVMLAGSEAIGFVSLCVTLAAFPVAIAIAVSRYRLYDIDRLINRAVSYGVLTVALVGAYGAIALLVGLATGAGSALPTAAGTLAAALLFRPARDRVQEAVDKRFDRRTYDALQRIRAFLEEVRAGRAAPEATGRVLAEALGDPTLEIRYRLPGEEGYVDPSGAPVAEQESDGRTVTPVTRGADRLGVVLHDPALARRGDLVDDAIAAAGLAIEITRLRVEVARQLAAVEESRRRILTAGDAERRRLERDLHDGAQQRLVTVGLALRHVQHELEPGEDRVSSQLDGAVDEIAQAIAELRELANGVRPSLLEHGLEPALRELARRAPLPVEVECRCGDGLAPELETAAYFVAAEGLTNAVKHAGAGSVRVSAARENGTLRICVDDAGGGGATPRAGSGLSGLSDRVSAHGGQLSVESPDGRGTRLVAELPCAS